MVSFIVKRFHCHFLVLIQFWFESFFIFHFPFPLQQSPVQTQNCHIPDHVQAHVVCREQCLGDPHLSEPLDTDLGHRSYVFNMQKS